MTTIDIPIITDETLRRLSVIAKLYGSTVVDWPSVKKLMQQHLPPHCRRWFSSRLSNKKIRYPNAAEKLFISYWESVTGVSITYPTEKMFNTEVPILRRGQSTYGLKRQQHQKTKKDS